MPSAHSSAASTRAIAMPSIRPALARRRRFSSVLICSQSTSESHFSPLSRALTHACVGRSLLPTREVIAAQITVRVNVLKNFELHWPVLETFGPAGKWYVNASAQEYNEALVCASKEMQRLLMRITGWDAVETYMYMSVQSDVEISQGCKPCEVQLSLRIGTPKLTEFPPLVG